MNYSPAYVIAEYLISQGELSNALESGDWKVYIGSLPDGADVDHDAVASIDTTNVKDGREMGSLPLFHYGVQLLVRSSAYMTGYVKAQDLADALGAIQNATVTVDSSYSYEIANVTDTSGVISIGFEEGTKRRNLFSVNFLVTIKEV